MIRKDFTLQNYVGDGGNCDARAVRCFERIARYHIVCEHQLCHLPAWQNQSQQNIQELGQTMKTLNQFYNASLNRSVVEVPDENGRETRVAGATSNHGCSANVVQGNAPVDFNGASFKNDPNSSSIARRLIGSGGHPTGGTAEPEMRGLYMLLTIDNDGGSEVLKYAGQLFKDRPSVYHSRPVQLALSIYKVSLFAFQSVLLPS